MLCSEFGFFHLVLTLEIHPGYCISNSFHLNAKKCTVVWYSDGRALRFLAWSFKNKAAMNSFV